MEFAWQEIRHRLLSLLQQDDFQHFRGAGCLLRQAIGDDSSEACDKLRQLVASGYSLRTTVDKLANRSLESWLEPRLLFAHARCFEAIEQCATVVSSRLGRDGRRLPRWPSMLDRALQHVHESHSPLLIVDGTTLAEVTLQFASTAELRILSLHLPKPRMTLATWLDQCIVAAGARDASAPDAARPGCQDTLFVSPTVFAGRGEAMHQLPLRDRTSIALARSVHAIHLRDGGTLDTLLQRRLLEATFPAGCVFVYLSGQDQDSVKWLKRGAVGRLIQSASSASSELTRCRTSRKAVDDGLDENRRQAVQQICLGIDSAPFFRSGKDASDILVHCTRGNSGALPGESTAQHHERLWMSGVVPECHPLYTLDKICRERRLLGDARLTRTSASVVSFSNVPLAELLSRRKFLSHLGRWDWEPYGVLIRKSALQAAGARPVQYGSELDYAHLADTARPFFQPHGQHASHDGLGWQTEREWRFVGHLDLSAIDASCISIFVRSRSEALQMSRRHPWPVLWYQK